MFTKDQFCLLKNYKNSNSERDVCVSAKNTKVIELLQQQNQNLIQEIKIPVEGYTQLTFTCSKSTISTVEKRAKYVQS